MKLKTVILYDADNAPILVNEKDAELFKAQGYSSHKKSADTAAAKPKVKKDKVNIED